MISNAFEPYKQLVKQAFSKFLLPDIVSPKRMDSVVYTSEAPNSELLKNFLTRQKEGNNLTPNWCCLQCSRGPLTIDPEDEHRSRIVRTKDQSDHSHETNKFGFGLCDFTFHLWANNGVTMEYCEVLYYYHLYKVRNISYVYEDQNIKSMIIHENLGSFALQDLKDFGPLHRIDWMVKFHVPVLIDSETGEIVESITTDIYVHDHGDDLDDLTTYPGQLAFSFTVPES